jgi:hypothetical protein
MAIDRARPQIGNLQPLAYLNTMVKAAEIQARKKPVVLKHIQAF